MSDLGFRIFRKKIHLFFSILFFSQYAFSQVETIDSLTSNKDSVLLHKVMLIPYDPKFYLSDAERDIISQTKKEPELIRENFRRTIDLKIKHEVEKTTPCISLLDDSDSFSSLKIALAKIYSKTGYRYDQPMPLPFHPEKKEIDKKKKNSDEKESLDSKIAAKYITVKGTDQYMNVIITSPAVLSEIYDQYGTDIFVFINQFEIKTNYKSCLDIANEIYKREVMVHFSVFDKSGKQLAGAYAMTFFPSDSNNAYDIMKNCFPDIARFVANCIPRFS